MNSQSVIITRVNEEYIRLDFPSGESSPSQGLSKSAKKRRAQKSDDQPKTVFVLDGSGSMAGSRIERALRVLNALFRKVGKMDLIVFDGSYRVYKDVMEVPSGAIRYGGTSFMGPLNYLNTQKYPAGSVIFFSTDGEVFSREGEKINNMVKTSVFSSPSVQINVLGITSASDTRMLFNISQWGDVKGEYYSLKDDNDVDPLIENLSSHFCSETVTVLGNSYRLRRQPYTLFVKDTTHECPPSDETGTEKLRMFLLSEAIKNEDYDSLAKIADDLEKAQTFSAENLRKLPRDERKGFLRNMYESNGMLRELRQVVAKRSMTNDVMSKLFISARDARSSKLSRVVDKRATGNVKFYQEQDAKLLEIAESLKKSFEKDPISDEDNEYVCTISYMNTQELLEEGDCIGLGINVVPNPVNLVQPEKIQVKYISPCYFSCKQFLEQAAERGNVIYGGDDGLLKDSSNTGVKGVIPLFINDRHWSVGSIYARRMTGFSIDGDPSSATNKMVFYLYYKVLQTLSENPSSRNVALADQLNASWMAIYKRNPDILISPEDFIKDPSKRMRGEIVDFPLWLEIVDRLNLTKPEKLKLYLKEEALRRKTGYYSPPYYGDFFKSIEEGIDYPSHTLEDFVEGRVDVSVYDFSKYESYISEVERRADLSSPTISPENIVTGHPETDWLINDQINSTIGDQTGYLEKYQDYIARSPEENQTKYREVLLERVTNGFRQYLQQKLQGKIERVTTGMISLLEEPGGVSDSVFAILASRSCKLGVNIMRFARAAKTDEQVKMLVTGKYGNIVTVSDMDKSRFRHSYTSVNGKGYFVHCWIPSKRNIRRLGWAKVLNRINCIFGYDVEKDFRDWNDIARLNDWKEITIC